MPKIQIPVLLAAAAMFAAADAPADDVASPEPSSSSGGAAVTFGAIADCQYCDGPLKGVRYYRDSPAKLRAAVAEFNRHDLDFAVHLGDFIDREWESFDAVAPIYESLKAPHYHVLGNHDFSVPDDKKALVPGKLKMPSKFYDFAVKGWRFLVVDGNDVSLHAHPAGSEAHKAAQAYKAAHAPKKPDWNGAIGEAQVAWLTKKLGEAAAAGERAVIFCHFPIYPEDQHNLWNDRAILGVLTKHKGTAVAWINGHNHAGNYAAREGIHFLTLKGMVDTKENSFAIIRLDEKSIEVKGFGREPSRTLAIPAK
ncbi:MAG: metallophosphoesterase [Verrucomicrobiales bacterium]